jgi:hypothetical protein
MDKAPKVAAVPAQSMTIDFVMPILPMTALSLLSAQASSWPSTAVLAACANVHGAAAVHADPLPFPEKKSCAATAGGVSSRAMIAAAAALTASLIEIMAAPWPVVDAVRHEQDLWVRRASAGATIC